MTRLAVVALALATLVGCAGGSPQMGASVATSYRATPGAAGAARTGALWPSTQPKQRAQFRMYAIPAPGGANVTSGSDSAIWLSEFGGITRVDVFGNVVSYSLPGNLVGPQGIVTGPDAAIWFAATAGGSIGRIAPSGLVTAYVPPTANARPSGIANGPDGNLWFTEGAGHKIGRITPAGQITEFAIPLKNAFPFMIVQGPDNALWFSELHGYLGRIDTSGRVALHRVRRHGPAAIPDGIAAGADGNLWFTESRANRIGRMTPSGRVREFPIAATNVCPYGIALGIDKAMWFTQTCGDGIGRIDRHGKVTQYRLPAHSGTPQWIALGADGAMWFTTYSGGASDVGRLRLLDR